MRKCKYIFISDSISDSIFYIKVTIMCAMYVISNEKPVASAVGADERVLNIRAAKGSGEKSRYVVIQSHTANWIGLVSAEVIRDLVESAEDRMLLEVVKKGGYIGASHQTREAFEAWYLDSQVSSRLSKDVIGAWFDADMSQPLMAALVAKGFSNEKAIDVAEVYKKKFMELAGIKVSMDEKLREQLGKCLALLPDGYENQVAEKVADRLSAAAPAIEILDAL
jgi:hypothetical protein